MRIVERTHRRRQGRVPISVAAIVACALPQTPFAQRTPAAMRPIEVLACRYHDGRGARDLAAAESAFNEWMDATDAPPYSAYVLMPRARSRDIDLDLAWLGVWTSGAAMGESIAHFVARDTELGEVLGGVMECDTNTQYAVLTVRPLTEGRFGPLEVSSCTLRIGARIDAALDAIGEWVEYSARSGSAAAHWILFPAYGESSDAGYSFKWAAGYPSYEAFGRDYDEFYSGGVDTFAELLDPLMRCDSPRLYTVRPIRAGN